MRLFLVIAKNRRCGCSPKDASGAEKPIHTGNKAIYRTIYRTKMILKDYQKYE